MLTKERIENMRSLAETILNTGAKTNAEAVLAGYVSILIDALQGPREISEEQANHILAVENMVFTCDGKGKTRKRVAMGRLCLDIFGWSPWPSTDETVYIPSTTLPEKQ